MEEWENGGLGEWESQSAYKTKSSLTDSVGQRSPILPLSHSPILPFSNSPILPLSLSSPPLSRQLKEHIFERSRLQSGCRPQLGWRAFRNQTARSHYPHPVADTLDEAHYV